MGVRARSFSSCKVLFAVFACNREIVNTAPQDTHNTTTVKTTWLVATVRDSLISMLTGFPAGLGTAYLCPITVDIEP